MMLLPHSGRYPVSEAIWSDCQRAPIELLHKRRLLTKHYTSYNFPVLRDEFNDLESMAPSTDIAFAPARSSCACSSQFPERQSRWLYYTTANHLRTGFFGTAGLLRCGRNTVRAKETPNSAAIAHVLAQQNDNNALDGAQLLQGRELMRFMARYVIRRTPATRDSAMRWRSTDGKPEAIYGKASQYACPSPGRITNNCESTTASSARRPGHYATFSTFKPAGVRLRRFGPAGSESMTSQH